MARASDSDPADRGRDGGQRRGRDRRPAAARPAWDAATYGRPDDGHRRDRSAARGGSTGSGSTTRSPGPTRRTDRYATDPYQADPYQADPYQADPYQADPYQADPYQADPYPFSGERYSTESYQPESYQPESYQHSRWERLPPPPPEAPPASHAERRGTPIATVEPEAEPRRRTRPEQARAGRNLPAAIAVGVALIAAIVGSLYVWRPAFLAVIAVVVGIGTWELVRAIRTTGANPPLFPLLVGGLLMVGLAWWGQIDALTFGLVITVLASLVWRLADGPPGYQRDVAAAALVAVYVPFLAGFAALLASPADGDLRVLITLAGVVLSDTGGYVAGVLFGRHPMAPSVSPKKSWEGLLGSLVATGLGCAVLLFLFFHVSPWWGAGFGVAVSAAAVLGDLGESMVKRDLGVKDMSALLPGHGGLMDRLDSVVFAVPTSYALLLLLVPLA